jgi:DNA-3-methyladenine glycosylase I
VPPPRIGEVDRLIAGCDAATTAPPHHVDVKLEATMEKNSIGRCEWVKESPLYVPHHDVEWGVPVRDGRALWEHLVLDGFQAGLSWRTVLAKRDGFRRAFAGFVPERVARFGDRDVKRLLADAAIIRSRAKIAAAITNARAYLDLQQAGTDFSKWSWSFVGGRPIQNHWEKQADVPSETALAADFSKALKSKGFKFVGPTSVYAWMQAVGLVNDHLTTCFRYKPIARMGRSWRSAGVEHASTP